MFRLWERPKSSEAYAMNGVTHRRAKPRAWTLLLLGGILHSMSPGGVGTLTECAADERRPGSSAQGLDPLERIDLTVLVTPPLYGISGYTFCQVLNASRFPVTVGVKMVDFSGDTVGGKEWCHEQPLQPGKTCVTDYEFSVPESSMHCTFTFVGNRDTIRGTVQFFNLDEAGNLEGTFGFEAH